MQSKIRYVVARTPSEQEIEAMLRFIETMSADMIKFSADPEFDDSAEQDSMWAEIEGVVEELNMYGVDEDRINAALGNLA